MATALLLIDIQRAAFDGVRCPPIVSPDALVRSAGELIDAARRGNRLVVFVQHCEGAKAPFETGTVHWELHESLVPAPGETVLRKYASSSFEGTDLDAQLKKAEVDELVLCGLQSEFCVSNTARSALALGYKVHLARDGHGTWSSDGHTAEEIREQVNVRLGEAGAVVESTGTLARALRHA